MKIDNVLVLAGLGGFLFIGGCSSAPVTPSPENTPDVVLSRIDDLSSRPSWVRESEPFIIQDGQVLSLGQTSLPVEDRVEAGFRIAENNAKAAVATAIEQRLEFVFQNAEEGTAINATQARYIGAEAAKLTTSSLRLHKRYWEKMASTQDNGQRLTRYRIFTTITMPEADFKRSVMDAIKKQQGKGGLSADFAKKVDQHWDQFVGTPAADKPNKTE